MKKNDVFMERFKLLKRRNAPADLSSVIDFSCYNEEFCEDDKVKKMYYSRKTCCWGLKSSENMCMFEFKRLPGVFFIPNPFTCEAQRYWITRCFVDYPCKPNVCNLDKVGTGRGNENLWHVAHESNNTVDCYRVRNNLQSLRWITLGYHYDWTNKANCNKHSKIREFLVNKNRNNTTIVTPMYHFSSTYLIYSGRVYPYHATIYVKEHHSVFPPDLACLSAQLAAVVGYDNYSSEAAIVNYYHMDSSLSGHTDHSEFDLEAPLISVSFGQSCVFLVGGKDKSVEPEAMFLHSGDIVIMTGEARLNYHAVPKVIPTANHAHSYTSFQSDTEVEAPPRKRTKSESSADVFCSQTIDLVNHKEKWKPFAEYLKTSRINMNVRQVFERHKSAEDYDWPLTEPNKPENLSTNL